MSKKLDAGEWVICVKPDPSEGLTKDTVYRIIQAEDEDGLVTVAQLRPLGTYKLSRTVFRRLSQKQLKSLMAPIPSRSSR